LSSPTTRQAQGPSTHCVSTFFGVQNQELNVDGNGDASSSAFLEKNEFRTKPEGDGKPLLLIVFDLSYSYHSTVMDAVVSCTPATVLGWALACGGDGCAPFAQIGNGGSAMTVARGDGRPSPSPLPRRHLVRAGGQDRWGTVCSKVIFLGKDKDVRFCIKILLSPMNYMIILIDY